jgi:hypothetical protein
MRLVLLALLLPTSALAQLAFPTFRVLRAPTYSRQQYDQSLGNPAACPTPRGRQ